MPAGLNTVVAPIGGMNAYDSIAGMPETDAIALVNWFPQVYGCYLRRGTKVVYEGLSNNSRTLVDWSRSVGIATLLAISGGNLYDVSTPNLGAVVLGVPGTPLVTGLATNYFQGVNFSNIAGSHMLMFSGQDDPIWLHDDDTTTIAVSRLTAGDGIVSGTWKNIDPAKLMDGTIHQRRVWAVEKASTNGWYLPPDQVYGDATYFDFGPLFRHGGYLQCLATWTVDSGDGSDDLLCAISSEGDVAVYTGIDPANPDTWALKGVYYAGKPVSGQRFWDKVGSDLKMVTMQGLISFGDMVSSTKTSAAQNTVEARKVQQPLSDIASQLGSLPGWECVFMPGLNMLIINVPSVDELGPTQFVENVVNSAWCEFHGWRATSFTEHLGQPYFTDDSGLVFKAWEGHVDNVSDLNPDGDMIEARVQQAYTYYGQPTVSKQVGMYRPNFLVQTGVQYGSAIAYDYTFITPAWGATPGATKASRWDAAIWDLNVWYGTIKPQRKWEQGKGMGFAGSLCMITRADNEVTWVSTDYTVNISKAVF